MNEQSGFVFSGPWVPEPQAVTVAVPMHIETKHSLMAALAESLDFPDYFGANLDALDETMMQTRYQVPRGAMADAEQFNRLYLIKNVTTLRATYQIRLLAYRATKEGLKLVIRLPSGCRFQPSLLDLIKKTGNTVQRENY